MTLGAGDLYLGLMADYPSNQALAMLIEQEGVTGLAALCGVTEGTVRNWRKNGRVTGAAARLLEARTGTPWRDLVGSQENATQANTGRLGGSSEA